MHDYWTSTALLFHRKREELSDDERASLRFYIALIDDMDGLTPNSAPRRWCAAARAVEEFTREHGRLPAPTDPGPLHAWVELQRTAVLNAFQRDRLRAIRGWSDV
ncbi:hypothetical protein [Microbacterium enclense]|uniref:Helicase-associated domain-containing protein n=1 Tax=Microbacterium enclense TaxID=993073 RepID=A0A1G6ICP8_9MICO|nr:hypothetical protein [Microbacterium enclense]KSU55016.1 hypothetical protein AS029_06085 [Microbacterium enclense]SDC04309.1 hypothetical protein SAMN05216418_1474 [Microbacterium enclense]